MHAPSPLRRLARFGRLFFPFAAALAASATTPADAPAFAVHPLVSHAGRGLRQSQTTNLAVYAQPLVEPVARARPRAPGIGSDGRLMEWGGEFMENAPAHRHVSRLSPSLPAAPSLRRHA